MAYPITNTALERFKASAHQGVKITFSGTNEDLELTEADILQGGMSLNRCSTSGDKIELGNVTAGELSLNLDNSKGQFNDVTFEGAEMFVQLTVGINDVTDTEYIMPLGYFTIDNAPRKLQNIQLTALDRMVLFDKPVDYSKLKFPVSVKALLSRICELCNVKLKTKANRHTNGDYIINHKPETKELTYRQLLVWICEITGTCAFMDCEGQLVLKWYTGNEHTETINGEKYKYETPIETVTPSERFSSDLQENAVKITGVRVETVDDVYLSGTENYAVNIVGNELIQHDAWDISKSVLQKIGENLKGSDFEYTPFTASIKPMPHLYPLDVISFTDKNGIEHRTIITSVTFILNGNTSIEGKGETATNSGYASANPLTKRESAIVSAIRKEQNKELSANIQNVLAFNELISNALGLFVTPVPQDNGTTIYYMHDQVSLEESLVIFTMTSGGIAWTNQGWNNGNPQWQYGATSAGDALFRNLSAQGIHLSQPDENYTVEITPKSFEIKFVGNDVTKIVDDEMEIPKMYASGYSQTGCVRTVNHHSNMEDSDGIDIVFV